MNQLLMSNEITALNLPSDYLQAVVADAEARPRSGSTADIHYYRSPDFPTIGVVVKADQTIVLTQMQAQAMTDATREAHGRD